MTRSGSTRSRPLFVRLSQLAMQAAERMPQRARRLDPVHLLGGGVDQRRDEHDVRRLLAEKLDDGPAHGNGALRRPSAARSTVCTRDGASCGMASSQ